MTILLFGIGFAVACLAALRWPVVGVLAYMANYIIAPEKQWWGEPLRDIGVRFSFYLALFTAIGLVLQWQEMKAKLAGAFWHSQEILIGAFVAVILLSRVWGVAIDLTARDLSGTSETPAEKIPKVALFVLIMSHSLLSSREVRWAFLLLILVGGLYLGVDAYTASPSRYVHGRLDALGGTDFRESSAVAAHLALVAILTGVYFLHTPKWWVKGACLVAGGFIVNAIILTQTRAAMLGLLAGAIAAFLLARRGERMRICVYSAVALVAALALTNRAFWSRAESIAVSEEQLDGAAVARLDVWHAGLAMWQDNPLGVGAGSFYTTVGLYDPAYTGRDCHNTYIRCAAELGFPGLLVLGALIFNAFRTLRRAPRLAMGTPIEHDLWWYCYAMQVGLVAYLTAGIFMGLTYIEGFWWFLCLPVCLERAALSARAEQANAEPVYDETHGDGVVAESLVYG